MIVPPEAFQPSNRLTFDRPLSETDVTWWIERFYLPHGLLPLSMADRLCGGARGERQYVYRHISALSESFELAVEGSDEEGRLWFHASLMDIANDRFLWDAINVQPRARRQGISKAVARGLFETCVLLGLAELRVEAEHIGGFLWAYAGFEPDPGSWPPLTDHLVRALGTVARHLAPARMSEVTNLVIAGRGRPETLLAIARLSDPVPSRYDPGLTADDVPLGLAMLAGAHWSGTVDLHAGPSRRRFEEWLSE